MVVTLSAQNTLDRSGLNNRSRVASAVISPSHLSTCDCVGAKVNDVASRRRAGGGPSRLDLLHRSISAPVSPVGWLLFGGEGVTASRQN